MDELTRERLLLLNTIKRQPLALYEQRDLDLHVITEPQFAGLYGDRWTVHRVADVEDLSEVRRSAFALRSRGPINHVAGAAERTVPAAAYLRSLLALPGPGFDTANRASNKLATKTALSAAGVPVAGFTTIAAAAEIVPAGERLGWPVILKPILGTGSQHTIFLNSAAEARGLESDRRWVRLAGTGLPVIVEQFIRMDWEFHCEAVVRGSRPAFADASRSLLPRFEGFGAANGSYSLHPDDDEAVAITALCREVVEVLGISDAVVHLEGFRTPQGLLAGEIAIRPAGGGIPDLVRFQTGVDLWDAFVRLSLGEELQIRPQRRPGTFAECWMPVSPGRVEQISTQEELLRLPGVQSATIHQSVGEKSDGPEYAWSRSADFVVHGDDAGQAVERINTLQGAFRLITG